LFFEPTTGSTEIGAIGVIDGPNVRRGTYERQTENLQDWTVKINTVTMAHVEPNWIFVVAKDGKTMKRKCMSDDCTVWDEFEFVDDGRTSI
jgi:hypothetical protein